MRRSLKLAARARNVLHLSPESIPFPVALSRSLLACFLSIILASSLLSLVIPRSSTPRLTIRVSLFRNEDCRERACSRGTFRKSLEVVRAVDTREIRFSHTQSSCGPMYAVAHSGRARCANIGSLTHPHTRAIPICRG